MHNRAAYLPEIDRLRGVAILFVLFHHVFGQPYGIWGEYVPLAFTETWTGVDLFFVISGFVVYRSMRDGDGTLIPLRSFYRRRFWRIAPLAVLCSVLPVGLLFITQRFTPTSSPELLRTDLIRIFTLSYNYAMPYSGHSSFLLAPYWSLCVEEHFYLFFPLLLLVLPGRKSLLCLCTLLFVFTPTLRALVAELTHPENFPLYLRTCTHCRLDGLFLGVMIAEVTRRWDAPEAAGATRGLFKLLFWAFSICLLLTPNLIVSPWTHNLTLSLNALISGGLVFLASQNRGWVPRVPGLEAVGRLSYSLYLLHLPALYCCVILFGVSGRDPSPAQRAELTAVFLAILAVLAVCAHRWIEIPLRRFGRSDDNRRM